MSDGTRNGGVRGVGDVGDVGELARKLLSWYGRIRRDLPWRRTRDPYAIWVSETMLQQTRVETVIPYYARFLASFPDVLSLAEAPEERVLALWSGLGYYRRARMLHAAAKVVTKEHGGTLPGTEGELRELPGVGAYTAGAVASIAFQRRAALVDGNVARVLSRLFAIEEDVRSAAGSARVWAEASRLVAGLPAEDGTPGDWNQALMELGATVCTPRTPSCHACPVAQACLARRRDLVEVLPRTPARKRPRAEQRVAIVLASRGEVLLARRRQALLFGGLWEVPAADRSDRLALIQRLRAEVGELRPAGSVEHVLSHRRLLVDVVLGPLRRRRRAPPGDDYDAVDVVPLEELRDGVRPHATLTRKVLAAAGVATLAKAPHRGVRSTSK
ncbi:MAG TPA: A/G-specific adenine glycosylase [Polyangiaceae bacterium]|jgi:A/G-specific adenine glycosylase